MKSLEQLSRNLAFASRGLDPRNEKEKHLADLARRNNLYHHEVRLRRSMRRSWLTDMVLILLAQRALRKEAEQE